MSKQLLIIAGIVVLFIISGLYLTDYLALGKQIQTQSSNPFKTPTDRSDTSGTEVVLPDSYKVQTVADNLHVPWAIAFTNNESFLVAERNGAIRRFGNGKQGDEPLITLPVTEQSESGLMGLVIDPDYETNKNMYGCYTYQNGANLANRVVKLKDNQTNLTVESTIIENAPSARFHAGCELAIGPDKKLYITFGDATQKSLAQDKNSVAGKILRLNLDGSIPADNPFPNSPIWSLGHRNPQGITWDLTTGQMYSAEHGPSGNDGPLGGDEINHIEKGNNYGWPLVSHDQSQEGLIDPMLVFTPAVAPGSIQFYSGTVYPELTNTLLFATLKGEGLYRAVPDPADTTKISEFQKLPLPALGRIREVIQGPDGYLYITTSNTDGRGKPQDADDTVLKLLPATQ